MKKILQYLLLIAFVISSMGISNPVPASAQGVCGLGLGGPIALNRQTGLFEQFLTITNNSPQSLQNGRVQISNSDLDRILFNSVNPPFSVQSNSTPLASSEISIGRLNVNQDVAQSFQLSSTANVFKVELYMKQVGTAEDMTVRIVTDQNGLPSTNVVSEGTLASPGFISSYQWNSVLLLELDPVVLAAGTTYWLVIDAPSSNANNYYTIGANTSYASGQAKTRTASGPWTNSGSDINFNLFTITYPEYLPITIAPYQSVTLTAQFYDPNGRVMPVPTWTLKDSQGSSLGSLGNSCAPTTVNVSPACDAINLSWDRVEGATSYTLKRYKTDLPANPEVTTTIPQTTGTPVTYSDPTFPAPPYGIYKYGVAVNGLSVTHPGGAPVETFSLFVSPNECLSNEPDLVASVPYPTSATSGVPQDYSSTITNQGTAPTGASFTNLFQVSLSSDGSNPTNYEIPGMPALVVDANAVTTKNLTLSAGTYYMRVCADNNASFVGTINEGANEGNNCSSGSPWTQLIVSSIPVPVVTISANPTSGIVNNVNPIITWSATNNPTSCNATEYWTNNGPKPFTGFPIHEYQGILTSVMTYRYTLTCSNASGTSAPATTTVVVSAPPGGGSSAPSTPTGLNATANTCGTKRIDVSWNTSSGATSYTLRDGGIVIYTGYANSFAHTNLAPGSSHSYSVRATNSAGSSLYSTPTVNSTAPNACPGGGPATQCSNPMRHYFCGDGVTEGTNQVSTPTKWEWRCGSNSCVQNKSPIIIED